MKSEIDVSICLKATVLSLSIWIVAMLINTIIVMYFLNSFEFENFSTGVASLILCFSAIFSAPGFLILWFTTLFQFKKKKLFRILLTAVLVGASLASGVIMVMTSGSFENGFEVIVWSPVVVASLSVIMHRPFINRIVDKNHKTCIRTL